MLNVGIQGTANLAKTGQDLSQARERVRELLGKASHDFANRSRTTIMEKYLSGGQDRLNVKSGRLRSSIRSFVEERPDEITVTFGSDVPYAAIHEFGGVTPPHKIEARRADVLSFMLGGKRVFARSVNHPGSHIRPRPFLTPGVEDEAPKYEAAIMSVLERAVTGAWHGQ
jgi:phage gpG-like protein